MTIRLFLAALALICGLATAPEVRAQAGDPFTVTDINVDLTRETSAIARQEAIEQAHVEAFAHLLERLTPADERGRLPRSTFALAADHANALKIEDEAASSTRYAAKMTIAFDPDRVRATLRDRGISYAETQAPPVIIAPLYAWAGAVSLWEPNNPWRLAWTARGPAQGLAPVMLPEGDLADTGALSAPQAAARNRASLGAFAARYGAAGVLLAEASFEIDPVSGRPKLDVVAEVFGDGPDIGRFRHSETGEPGAQPEALGLKAADAVVAALEAAWKREAAGAGGAVLDNLVADLAVGSLRDFADVRRRLDASPGVARHELVALSRERARFRLYYTGTPETLRAGVARQSMDLAPAGADAEVEWVLIAPPTTGLR